MSLKQRLVGAVVLIALAVIFLPMLLDGSGRSGHVSMEMEIPPEPVYDVPSRLPPLPGPESEPAPVETQPRGTPRREATASALPAPTPEKKQPVPAPKPKPKPKPPAETVPEKPVEASTLSAWVVQVGSFSTEDNALVLRDKLRARGFTAFVEPHRSGQSTVYRVRVGPELKRETADALQARLKKEQKLDGIVMSHP